MAQSVNNATSPSSNQLPRIMLRFGVATVCNVVLIFVFPKLALHGPIRYEVWTKFLAASVSVIPLVVLLPVFRVRDFAYKLAALALWLFPALVFVGSLWSFFVRFGR